MTLLDTHVLRGFGSGTPWLGEEARRTIENAWRTGGGGRVGHFLLGNEEVYKQRNEVERLFRRLKEFQRIFTRYDKLDVIFVSFIYLALIVEALR